MNDNENEYVSEEARIRAERINAIRNSIRGSLNTEQAETAEEVSVSDDSSAAETLPDIISEIPPKEETKTDVSAVEEAEKWESELAEKIAMRVQSVKAAKSAKTDNTARDILNEIDRILTTQDTAPSVVKESTEAVLSAEDIVKEADVQPLAAEEDEVTENVAETSEKTVDTADDTHEIELPAEEAAVLAAVSSGQETDLNASAKDQKKPVEKSGKKKKKRKKKTFAQRLRDLFPKKGDKLGERIRKIVFLGAVAAIIVCGYIVADYYIGNANTQNRYDNLMDMYSAYDNTTQPPAPTNTVDEGPYYELLPGARKLLDVNDEIVGVINIPGTNCNYPVVQSLDMDKYLHLDVTGNEAKAGAIFMDSRCRYDHVENHRLTEPNSANIVLYGHNMADEMMFGCLRNYMNYYYYYGEHPVIEFNSNYCTYTYKIFSFFIVDAEDTTETKYDCWNDINFNSEADFYDYVNEAKRRTIRTNDVDVKYGDPLLTLSTCNSIFGNSGSGRLIVMARLVRPGEDPYEGTQDSQENTNVKWPSLYYKYRSGAKPYDPDLEFVPYGKGNEKPQTTSAAKDGESSTTTTTAKSG